MADSRDTDIGTDAEPSENETGFAGHLLSTGGARHYTEPQLVRSPNYSGPLERLSEDEVRALANEILLYLVPSGSDELPLPPVGLPGTCIEDRGRGDPTYRLLKFGWRYFKAAIRSEGRAMNNLWAKAEDFYDRDLARQTLAAEARAREEAFQIFSEHPLRAPRQGPEPLVYFIAAASGPIKIGIAVDPRARLAGLQTGHHEKLELLATCAGGKPLESEYHRQFGERRLNGEWFERCPEILAEIERLSG